MFKKGDRVWNRKTKEAGSVVSWSDETSIVALDNGESGIFPNELLGPVDTANPDHYKVGGMEVIDILKAKLTPEQFKGFLVGNALKYLFRCDHKNGQEDLDKALWYVTMLAGKDPRK